MGQSIRNARYLGPVVNIPPFAPNDNNYVNTVKLGEKLIALTDSFTMLDLDPEPSARFACTPRTGDKICLRPGQTHQFLKVLEIC